MPETEDRISSPVKKDTTPFLAFFVFSLFFILPVIAGVEDAWVQGVLSLCGSLTLLFIIRASLREKKITFVKTAVNKFVIIFFLLSLLSITPLPSLVLKYLSPQSERIFRGFAPFQATGGLFDRLRTISVSPYRSALSLSVISAFAVLFFCLINNLDRFRYRVRIANIIVFMGTLIAGWGLLSMRFPDKRLFWFREIISGTPTGPFINTIHYSHFLALCIPLSLGLWAGKIGFSRKEQQTMGSRLAIVKTGLFFVYTLIYLVPAGIMAVCLVKGLSRGGGRCLRRFAGYTFSSFSSKARYPHQGFSAPVYPPAYCYVRVPFHPGRFYSKVAFF